MPSSAGLRSREEIMGDQWEAVPNRELLQVRMPEGEPASSFSSRTCHSLPACLTGGTAVSSHHWELRSVIDELYSFALFL